MYEYTKYICTLNMRKFMLWTSIPSVYAVYIHDCTSLGVMVLAAVAVALHLIALTGAVRL
jgi:hypothetical protein